MITETIPCHLGEPMLDERPRQSFRVSPEGITTSTNEWAAENEDGISHGDEMSFKTKR